MIFHQNKSFHPPSFRRTISPCKGRNTNECAGLFPEVFKETAWYPLDWYDRMTDKHRTSRSISNPPAMRGKSTRPSRFTSGVDLSNEKDSETITRICAWKRS
jgi:hypothetical protein